MAELRSLKFDELLSEVIKNEQYRELVEEHLMKPVYGIHERLFSFAFDESTQIERTRVVAEKAKSYEPIDTDYFGIFLKEFGRLIRRIHIYCPVSPYGEDSKKELLTIIRTKAIHIEEITFDQCTVRDLNGWKKAIESVVRVTLIATEFAENKKCNLAEVFPNVRHLSVEAVGDGWLHCIEQEFKQLRHFEFIDHRSAASTRSHEIQAFLANNPHLRSVSLHGAFQFDDTKAISSNLAHARRLEINAPSEFLFNAPEIVVPTLNSLIITESDTAAHDNPIQLPFAPADLKTLTVFRTRINQAWCNMIGNSNAISRLSLPIAVLDSDQLKYIVDQLPELEMLTIRWSVENLDALIEIMNRESKLEMVLLVGLNIRDIVQRKLILRRLNVAWETINNANTVDYITHLTRIEENAEDGGDEDHSDEDSSGSSESSEGSEGSEGYQSAEGSEGSEVQKGTEGTEGHEAAAGA